MIKILATSGGSFIANCKILMKRFGLELGTARKPLVCPGRQQSDELNKKLDAIWISNLFCK